MVPEKCPRLSKHKYISAIISKKLPKVMDSMNIRRNLPPNFCTQTRAYKK